MKKLPISSTLNLLSHVGIDNTEYVCEALKFHKQMGFEAVDFGTGLLNLSEAGWQERAEAAVESAKAADITLGVCHLPFVMGGGDKGDEYMQTFNAQMHNAIDAAVILGVKHAVMHPNMPTVPMIKFDRAEQYDKVMTHLAPFAEHAAKVGLSLALENMRVHPGTVHTHRFCQTPDELCEVADALGVGVCWDFGHANISGIKQSDGLRYVGKRLRVIHINDNVGTDDQHLPPFIGNVDWKDAMKGLSEIGYEGVFNFEVATGHLPSSITVRESFGKYLLSVAEELKSYM